MMCAWTGLIMLLLATNTGAAPAAPLKATRALSEQLARAGRGEATLSWTIAGVPGSPSRALRGTLAVEPPELARLDVAGTGERITLRADGGEWLQPQLKQFVKLSPRHSLAAMRWWRLLVAGASGRGPAGASTSSERYQEVRLAPGRYRLRVPATPASEADSAEVTLDARGLPARLVLSDGMGGPVVYHLAGWRFMSAKGATAFRLIAPPGVETVELP